MDAYDVIIIGSGAGGGTLARHLAPSGKRILLLERGGFMPREIENWDSQSVWIDKRYANSGKWTDAATGKQFTPKQHYYIVQPEGRRLLDLALGPLALSFLGASGKRDLKRVRDLHAQHGPAWTTYWLEGRGL